jgi:hypothetical protein
MKHLFLGLLLCLLLMAVTCRTKETARLGMLQQTWLHSHEEDQGEILTYRPNTYDFPPSRGRTGFTFNEDGAFIQYEIAPTDGLEERLGTWKLAGRDQIRVSFAEGTHQDFLLEIVTIEPNLLRVRRRLPE